MAITIATGEALTGDGNELAHIDLLIGSKSGPVGAAFASAFTTESEGHTNLLAVVTPNLQSFAAAAANTNWAGLDHFFVILTDAAGKDSWPIAGATFILVYKQPVDPAATSAALKFFKWSYEKGDDMARSLDYVPLPDSAVSAIEASWKQVQGSGM